MSLVFLGLEFYRVVIIVGFIVSCKSFFFVDGEDSSVRAFEGAVVAGCRGGSFWDGEFLGFRAGRVFFRVLSLSFISVFLYKFNYRRFGKF